MNKGENKMKEKKETHIEMFELENMTVWVAREKKGE